VSIKKTHTILLVDDEQDLLDNLKLGFRRSPYEVLTAASAEDGAAVLRTTRVDVVVSDERMPGLEGSRFLAFVRRYFPDTVRITLTGQASIESAQRAVNEAAVYRFLTKPCSVTDLRNVIDEALAERGKKVDVDDAARETALRWLEEAHPGIADVERDASGAIVLDLDEEGEVR
jgi:DNA-binding NtrC family response regulator